MAGKYQRYPEYKDSGVDWLGRIPFGWQTSQLKYEAKLVMGQSPDSSTCNNIGDGIPFLQGKAEFGRFHPSPKSFCTAPKKQVDKDTLLVSVRAPVGATNWADQQYAIGRGLCGIQANENKLKFITYLITAGRKSLLSLATGSTFEAISSEQLGSLITVEPSDIELEKIIQFLDYETAKINALIAKQEKLIELLKEKRQAVISHAVTKGLNPDVSMKDSGIEWLGLVPKHWVVKKIKHLVKNLEQGWSPLCDSRPAEIHEYGVLKVGCVNGGIFNPKENKFLPTYLEPRIKLTIAKHDLLISRANTKELVGSAAVALKDYRNLILCDKLYRLKLTAEYSPHFIALVLSTSLYRSQIELEASGASHSMQNIGQASILELPVAIAPLHETREMLDEIASKVSKLNTTMENASLCVSFLKERKSSLISAAVTGKIDVRNWQPTSKEEAHA